VTDGAAADGTAADGAAADVVGAAPTVEEATNRAVARLNIFTYVGAVLGGAMTGVFATTDTLRLGFGVLAVLALATVVLAGRFREAVLPVARADQG